VCLLNIRLGLGLETWEGCGMWVCLMRISWVQQLAVVNYPKTSVFMSATNADCKKRSLCKNAIVAATVA